MSRISVATCWERAVRSSSACPRSLSRAALRHLDRMERSAGASRRLAVAGEGHRGEPGSAENLVGILSLRGPVAATACWRSAPGSGYQTAVLSQLVKQVYTIEIIEALANAARARLESLGYSNVALRAGDGYRVWPEAAPFDRIILTSAPPEVPQALVGQLKPGGRLVAPVGRSPFNQNLIVLDKDDAGRTKQHSVIPVRFVPMVPGK